MAKMKAVIEPGKVISWEDFVAKAPDFSLALDGYVSGQTRMDNRRHLFNFNHHEGVDRFSTRSTSGIVQVYLRTGLMNWLTEGENPTFHGFFNDPDQDSSLVYWMLNNPDRVKRGEPLLNRLIHAEDMLDATGGIYPFSLDSSLMRQVAWTFKPYTDAIKEVYTMSPEKMLSVMDAVSQRIDKHILGKGEEVQPDTRMDVIYQGKNFIMVNEIGAYARAKLFEQGHTFYVSYRGENPKGVHRFTLGKMCPFAPGNVEEILADLNVREGISTDNPDRWGGGNAFGGSPRKSGSKYTPGQLCSVLDEIIK